MIWNKVHVNKMKAIIALALVFLLVLATNMMDNHHFEVVKQSLKTVYEDRLVVKDYIYKMSDQLNRKQLALLKSDSGQIAKVNAAANDSLQVLVERYATTKLTPAEANQFRALQENLSRLYDMEESIDETETIAALEDQYATIGSNLAALFEIQLQEGKRQIESSNRAIARSDLMSQIEIGILIAIGLIIQVIILYKPRSNR